MAINRYEGRCHCGAVRFSWQDEPRFVGECVCESCRRTHGATLVGWVGISEDAFRLDAGEESLKWYSSSELSRRGFCSGCGTTVFFRSSKWAGEVHMALACIKEPHDLVSKGVAFADELPHWSVMKM